MQALRTAEAGAPVGPAQEQFEARHAAIAQALAPGLGEARARHVQARLHALGEELRELLQGVRLLGECPPRVRAHVLCLGERAACVLLGAGLAARALAPSEVDARAVLPCEGDPLQATPLLDAARPRLARVREATVDGVWLMPGFFGGDAEGKTMCLGRGGSDYSAALVAAALDAERLEIWTDVDGIFTADPRRVPEAFALPELTFAEAMELAHFGAKVLHPKTVAPVRVCGIADSRRCALDPAGVPLEGWREALARGVPGPAAEHFAAWGRQRRAGRPVVVDCTGGDTLAQAYPGGGGRAGGGRGAGGPGGRLHGGAATARRPVAGADGRVARAGAGASPRGQRGAGRVPGGPGRAAGGPPARGGEGRRECRQLPHGALQSHAARRARLRRGRGRDGGRCARGRPAGGGREARMRTLRAYAPASIGNVAAGFDVLGAALAPLDGSLFGDVVELREADTPEFHCTGPFADRLPPRPEDNLVLHARGLYEESARVSLACCAVTLHKGLPLGSGLGSSSASIVAALRAFDAWSGGVLGDARLLALAGRAEGRFSGGEHLDNVAPALLGGLRLVTEEGEARALPLPAGLAFAVVSPELVLATATSRAALPAQVPLHTAVVHAQNLATFVHALHAGDTGLLRASTKDLLAEPHRAGLVQGFRAVQAAALGAGALGCSLSGSGPAVFALVEEGHVQAVGDVMVQAWREAGVASVARACGLDLMGARVLS